MSERPTKVLIVDDSAFARRTFREILSRDPRFEVVGTACDGLDALEKIDQLTPDVVTLDLVMPELDGIGVMKALSQRADAPRIVIVTMSAEDSEMGVAALESGAFDVVRKPTALATDRLYELDAELVETILLAKASRETTGAVRAPAPMPARRDASELDLVVIGASTGGPRALTEIVGGLPADLAVPVAIALHMPEGYTQAFARRLSELGPLRVREASDGMEIPRGSVVVAPAGKHLHVLNRRRQAVALLRSEPSNAPHRPSVDELFKSAAESFGRGVLGVVLTGMGDDGARGAQHIVELGGEVIVQSGPTCVVNGMPRAVLEAGVAAEEVPLASMAGAIASRATKRSE